MSINKIREIVGEHKFLKCFLKKNKNVNKLAFLVNSALLDKSYQIRILIKLRGPWGQIQISPTAKWKWERMIYLFVQKKVNREKGVRDGPYRDTTSTE